LKVLVLESGAARHNLSQQIPQHDLIVTNYSLLRRDLSALKKFDFRAAILDEAQFVKNPSAQVTQSVKQLRAEQRLALTGTPLENRLLDLWSIVDFIQAGYLGTQMQFLEIYEARKEEPIQQNIARRRLAAKLRPLLLRRLKRQVAQDLPERIEERGHGSLLGSGPADPTTEGRGMEDQSKPVRMLGIAGSLRRGSYNRRLLAELRDWTLRIGTSRPG